MSRKLIDIHLLFFVSVVIIIKIVLTVEKHTMENKSKMYIQVEDSMLVVMVPCFYFDVSQNLKI